MLGTHPVLLYLDLVRQGHWNHGAPEIFQSQRRQQRQEGQSSYSPSTGGSLILYSQLAANGILHVQD